MKKIARIIGYAFGFQCLLWAYKEKSFGMLVLGIGVIIAVIMTAIIEDRRPPP